MVQMTAAPPLLPSSATAPLRDALSTDESALDGRLTLDNAIVEASEVTVSFVNTKGGGETLTFVLGHPSQAPDALRAGPFAIIKYAAEDEGALNALIARLSKLSEEEIWLGKEGDSEQGSAQVAEQNKPKLSAGERRAKRSLWHANQALSVGDKALAQSKLDALSADPELPPNALLDLAEAYRRINALDATRASLERWKQATINDITSPVESARYTALKGEEVPVLKVLQDARVSHNACGFDKLALSMDAVGNRTEAYLLLDSAARKTDCLEVEATLLEWFVSDDRFYEADQLSAVLTQYGSGNARISAVRAMLLLAADKVDAVLPLLEPLIRSNPDSNLLSFYVRAQIALIPQDGGIEVLGARSDEATEDAMLAMSVALAYHAEGNDDAAKRYLKRAEATFKNHRLALGLRARLAFNRNDKLSVATLLESIDGLDPPDVKSPLDADIEALRGELLRWTDPPAAKDALHRALLLSARYPKSALGLSRRVKAQFEAMEECVKAKTPAPCPGPFLYPAEHPSNEDFDENADDSGGFGNWLIIAGVLLLFMVMVRNSRLNKERMSRSSRWK
mgnify:CR=1 FL=1